MDPRSWLEPFTPQIIKFQSVKTNRSCKMGRHCNRHHRYPCTSTVSDLLRYTLLKNFAVLHFEHCRMGKFYIQLWNVMNTFHFYHSQISRFILGERSTRNMRVRTLIVATIYLQLIQNRYMFWSFTVLQCSHQHCVQPVASDVEVVGYL